MRITLERGGKRWLTAALAGIITAAAQLAAALGVGMSLPYAAASALILGGAMLLAWGLRVEIQSWWGLALEQFCLAAAGVIMLQYVVMCGLFLPWVTMAVNVCIAAAILLFACIFTGGAKAAGCVWLVFTFGFGVLNRAIYMFRSSTITLNDLYSIGTALSVAGEYRFQLDLRMITSACILAVCLSVLLRSRQDRKRLRGLPTRGLCLALAVLTALVPWSRMSRYQLRTWGVDGVGINGTLVEFALELASMHVQKPENYSTQRAEEIVRSAEAVSENEDIQPHVIVIMAEALSDLSVLGEIDTGETQILSNLTQRCGENAIHGYALASVLGGGTADSEWEFLTGNTMAFMPSGSVPYRQYVRDSMHSLAGVMKNRGYACVAMHPFRAAGWDRSRIYPLTGFDELYFEPDLPWTDRVRGRISDHAFVEQVIAQYEAHCEEGPMFLFGVTMQNHGGYTNKTYQSDVRLRGLTGSYPEVEQYLSLTKLTDQALGELFAYFEQCEEPVQIVVFGDHQPSLSEAFYQELGVTEPQRKQIVPFIIWNNYGQEGEEIPLTSLNYLPALLLDAIGGEMPQYHQFLLETMKTLPAVNSLGFLDADGALRGWNEAAGESQAAADDYRIAQYGNMFDSQLDAGLFCGS